MEKTSDETLLATVRAVQEYGSQAKAAKALKLGQPTVSQHMKRAKERGLWREYAGQIEEFEAKAAPLPAKGKKRVYYLTSCQNNTKLHDDAWRNMMALREEDKATLLVSTFNYNKDAQGQRAMAKWESREAEMVACFPAEIRDFICFDRIDLAPNLTFCGELNVLPTAVNPLEGLENYTYRKSTIVPHPKLAMESIPTMKSEGVKLMFTTGCISRRNYIKRKAGFKAEHFHSYGFLLVEVDADGRWYCRQVIQGEDGSMYDMDRRAFKGKVTTGHRVADITWGDIHALKLDKAVAEVSFGHAKTSMVETLRPETQHVHDLLDFSPRSHHTRKDPHEVYRAFKNGHWELTAELKITADVLWNQIVRPWCETFVVNSNHDRHLERWLKEADWRLDPANAKTILALNLVVLQGIDADRKTNLTEVALHMGWDKIETDRPIGTVKFLAEDESHIILPKVDGGIECGLHGDRGSNGAKGTVSGIAKTDRKTNMADKHAAAICNHVYCCGLTGLLDQNYNHGLNSWTHAHIVTYPNGERAIYSIWKGKWRA